MRNLSTIIVEKPSPTNNSVTRILEITTVGITARAFLQPMFKELLNMGFAVSYAATDDEDARYTAQACQLPFFPVYISRGISWRDALTIYKLYRYIKREKFDVVHTHTAKAGFTGRLAAYLAGVPCIVHTAHGLTVHAGLPTIIAKFYLALERFIARRTTRFIAVTSLVKEALLKQGIVNETNCVVIPNCIDETRFQPALVNTARCKAVWQDFAYANKTIIGTAARFVEDKGLVELVMAHAALLKQAPETYLALAGNGPLRDELAKLVAQLGTQARVVFLGWLSDVPAFLATLTIFCAPTRREGFGCNVLEAQAMHCPVVTSRIRPLTDLLPMNSVAFVDLAPCEEMAQSLTATLIELLHNTTHLNQMADMGQSNAQHYDQAHYRQNIHQFFQELVISMTHNAVL